MKKTFQDGIRLMWVPALVGILFITACAKPTTRAPKLDASQVAAERAAQEQAVQRGQSETQSGQPINMLSMQEVMARLNRVSPKVQQSGTEICQQMYGNRKQCSFSFALADQDVLNAWADGKGVYITPKMVSFAATDEELANVLSHEYAHNVLSHPQSTGQNAAAGAIGGLLLDTLARSQGFDTGNAFSKIGAEQGQYHYSVAFEREADYVGMYILANAGYRVDGALNFWRKFTAQDGHGLERSRSHPSNPERTVAMQKTIDEINAKRAAKQPLLPEMKTK
jgi:predicted Zn-dependent protease